MHKPPLGIDYGGATKGSVEAGALPTANWMDVDVRSGGCAQLFPFGGVGASEPRVNRAQPPVAERWDDSCTAQADLLTSCVAAASAHATPQGNDERLSTCHSSIAPYFK